MKLVLVEWIDPTSFAVRWTDRDDFSEADLIKNISVGVLLRETESDVVVNLNLNQLHYSQAITIPKSCIKRIRYLKVK